MVSADAIVSGISADRTAVKSVSGDVTLDGVRSDITAQTVSGDLESRRLAGTLRFTTVSGDLTVVRGETDQVKAETVSGDLTLDLDLLRRRPIDVCSVSGDLTVRMPDDGRAHGGRQDHERVARQRLLRRPLRAQARQVLDAPAVGDGDGRLSAKTVSGDVTLLRRASNGSA